MKNYFTYFVALLVVVISFSGIAVAQQSRFLNSKDEPIYGGKSWFTSERQRMLNKFHQKEYDSIYQRAHIYSALHNDVREFRLLMIMEKELLLLIQGDYKQLLHEIEKNELLYFSQRNNRTYIIGYRFRRPPHTFAEDSFLDPFNRALLTYLELNAHQIKMAIKNAGLRNDEMNFLLYYLHLNIHYLDTCNERNKEILYDYTEEFMKRFKYSKYASMVEKYTPYRTGRSSWGSEFTIGLMGGYFIGPGTFKEHASTFLTYLPIGFGVNYNNFYANIQGSWSSFKFDYDGLEKHNMYSPFFGGNGMATVGYTFHVPNSNVTISPFVGTNRFAFIGMVSEKEEFAKEDATASSFTWRSRAPIYGVNIDLNFSDRRLCNTVQRESRAFHRFQLGVSSFSASKGADLFEGNIFFIQYVVGFQSQNQRRTPIIR